MSEVFLDSTYAIALSSPADQYHARAFALSERLEEEGVRLVTTRAVLIEIGNAMGKARFREAAVELIVELDEDPQVEVIPISEALYQKAFDLYRTHQDKEWGLTDCISFVVMRERGITEALTADEHFRQAGFGTLLEGD